MLYKEKILKLLEKENVDLHLKWNQKIRPCSIHILQKSRANMNSETVFRTVFRMVSEKETRMREGMKMMGMKDFPYWMSWLTYHTIINFMLSLIIFLILYFTSAITVSSPVILFLTPFLFGESLFGIMLVAQSFFETARMAAIVTTVLYLGSSTISELVDVPLYPTEAKLIGSLSPPVAMLFTVRTLT